MFFTVEAAGGGASKIVAIGVKQMNAEETRHNGGYDDHIHTDAANLDALEAKWITEEKNEVNASLLPGDGDHGSTSDAELDEDMRLWQLIIVVKISLSKSRVGWSVLVVEGVLVHACKKKKKTALEP